MPKRIFFLLMTVALSAIAENSQSDLEMGKKVYMNNCTACHGEKGDGQGPAARAIASRKPRNFIAEDFQYGGKPDEVYKTISEGVPGSAMPPWKGSLSEKERHAVVAYILSLKKR